MQETRVWSLGREDPLEKRMATHFSFLAWRVPGTEEPGRLQSMGPQRVRHDWMTFTPLYLRSMHSQGRTCIIIPVLLMRQWQPRSYSNLIKLEYTSSIKNPLQHTASLDQNLPYFGLYTFCPFLSFSWAESLKSSVWYIKFFIFLLRGWQMRVLFPL